MDTFMDKLAQKLTAQEMIKANTAADAEEMQKLKSQVEEYRDILDKMQKLIDDGVGKLENAKVDQDAVNSLMKACAYKIEDIQSDIQGLEHAIGAKMDSVNENAGHLELTLETKLDTTNENIHKECVKVYRNVQAVVVEENAKQNESITAIVNGLKGKLTAIFGISIAALIVAVGGVVFQILVYLHVI